MLLNGDAVLVGSVVLVLLFCVGLVLRSGGARDLGRRLEEQAGVLAKLDGQLQTIGASQETRMQSLSQSLVQAQDGLRLAVERQLGLALDDARAGRAELAEAFASLRAENDTRFNSMVTTLQAVLETNGGQLKNQLLMIQQAVAQQLANLSTAMQQQAEHLRATLNERLAAIQADNAAKLEDMRRIVDEKLHTTLEHRLGQSFQVVSERLEQVHRGLGEMQTLAAGVGDLKRVLSNVKARGIWGEVQLVGLIEQMLTPEQYGRNVAVRPGCTERVEVAIRLPGPTSDRPVWLPIDAKFPVEFYERLLEAHDRADAEGVESAARALEARLKAEARSVRDKYVEPPYTTDFAVLYLPTEGLYAEALRRPGLATSLQREHRIVLAGPTTLAALLNSLQIGFRTLAIEKRASEVWQVLGQVKSEFAKFGEVIEVAKQRLDQARSQFDKIGTRSRAIERRLREVEALPLRDEAMPVASIEGAPGVP